VAAQVKVSDSNTAPDTTSNWQRGEALRDRAAGITLRFELRFCNRRAFTHAGFFWRPFHRLTSFNSKRRSALITDGMWYRMQRADNRTKGIIRRDCQYSIVRVLTDAARAVAFLSESPTESRVSGSELSLSFGSGIFFRMTRS
jgi:hypothetical protein